MAIFRREPPNRGVECRWGRQKSLFSTNMWLSDRTGGVRSTIDGRPCSSLWQLAWSFVYRTEGAHQWSCLSQAAWRTTPKRREENTWIACSGQSEVEITNNRLRWTYCTTEPNYWQRRSIARPLCDSRAACMNSNNLRPRRHAADVVNATNDDC